MSSFFWAFLENWSLQFYVNQRLKRLDCEKLDEVLNLKLPETRWSINSKRFNRTTWAIIEKYFDELEKRP